MIAHGPVRAYVMGERGAKNKPATEDEITAMADIVERAIRAGANIEQVSPDTEVDWMCRLAGETGVPVTFLMLQTDDVPDDWRKHLDLITQAREAGHDITAQVAGRPFGLLMGLSARHRFADCASFQPLVGLTNAEKAERMRDPELRAALIAETKAELDAIREVMPVVAQAMETYDRTFPLGDPVDYEPSYEQSIAGIAEATGRDPLEVYYDALLERHGDAIVMMMLLNDSYGNGDALHEMLSNPSAVLGLADGGAHCNLICDASTPTWMLTHWARDRQGPQIPLETVIKQMTADTAALFDFPDRGRLEVGLRADLNVIDHERLTLHEPRMVADLPAGGTRFVQDAAGYDYTIVAGEITRENDAFTSARSGRLVRS